MSVGDWIRASRQAQRLTQAELAACLSVATSTVCRWERGRSRPRFLARRALMSLFGNAAPAERRRGAAEASSRRQRVTSAAARIALVLDGLAAPLDTRRPVEPRTALNGTAGGTFTTDSSAVLRRR